MVWSSGGRSGVVVEVCPGDLVTVRIAKTGGADEDPDAAFHPAHLVYAPKFGGRTEAGHASIGGMAAPTTDRLEYRLDFAPLWCPREGQIYLDGGGGRGPVSYSVFYERARCASRPPDDPTFTLRRVTGAATIPRGAYAVSVPASSAIAFGAVPHNITISPGQRFPLGVLAIETFQPVAGTLEAVAFHVRIG